MAESRARAERAAAEALADRFIRGYEQRDLSGIPSAAPDMTERFAGAVDGLDEANVSVTAAPVVIDETGATSELGVTWELPGGHRWRYATSLELVRADSDQPSWQVAWDAAVVHPELRTGERLRSDRRLPARGDIIDADGGPIVTPRPVVDVYVQPSRVDDLDTLADELADTLDIDGDDLAQRVEKATAADALVPVVTLREKDYRKVEDAVYPLAGTVFQRSDQPLAPTRAFARAFLGTVGEVTAEQLDDQPGRYERGDIVGRSGVQRAFDERLRGTAGIAVEVVADDTANETDSDGDVRELHAVEPTDGQDVAVTLRPPGATGRRRGARRRRAAQRARRARRSRW